MSFGWLIDAVSCWNGPWFDWNTAPAAAALDLHPLLDPANGSAFALAAVCGIDGAAGNAAAAAVAFAAAIAGAGIGMVDATEG